MTKRKENIVMFPFMAQRYISLKQTKKYTITLVNTPRNIKRLRSSLPPTSSSIHLLEIPFNSSYHNLPPEGAGKNIDSLPYHLVKVLLEATSSFKPHFKKLISHLMHDHRKPLCIITSMFFEWCTEIAKEFGVFHAVFITGGGFVLACYHSLWLNLPHRNTDSDEFPLPNFPEASRIHVTQLSDNLRAADGTDSLSVFLNKVLPLWTAVDGISVNTVGETGRPVWPIGPVLLSTLSGGHNRDGKELGVSTEACKSWLDKRPCSSVLYVSFGSQNTISASQMMELALALETSGKSFIWVLRPPIGDWLPEDFEERIKNSKQGLIVHRWAPQVDILSHEYVSAFLSHCGWNSVLEALSHGQFYNAKFLEEEIGVCVEVARGTSCEVRHEEIVKIIELVMDETEKGKEMRRRACEIKETIENAIKDEENNKGSSTKAMDEFFNAALTIREKTNVIIQY
ncbi:hypothetical protein ACOSP7_017326 [Xanthoceras sorbifolium]